MAETLEEVVRSEVVTWSSRIQLTGPVIQTSTLREGSFVHFMREEYEGLIRDMQRQEAQWYGRMDGIDYGPFQWLGISRLDPDLVMDVGL